jgi:hypothetical protein
VGGGRGVQERGGAEEMGGRGGACLALRVCVARSKEYPVGADALIRNRCSDWLLPLTTTLARRMPRLTVRVAVTHSGTYRNRL